MIKNGRCVYSLAGLVKAERDSRCCLCSEPVATGAEIVRVSAHKPPRNNWAGRCCQQLAEKMSGAFQ